MYKSKLPEYRIWIAIKQRCYNPNLVGYERYGGRGIIVCERWQVFEQFYADMGTRPSNRHSIERINNDGNYEPSNCRWATEAEQKRNTSQTHLVTFNGRTQCMADWAKEIGIAPHTLYLRLQRWPLDVALTTPPNPTTRRNHSKSRLVTYKGKTQCLRHWANELGIKYPTLQSRLNKGWPIEKALSAETKVAFIVINQ